MFDGTASEGTRPVALLTILLAASLCALPAGAAEPAKRIVPEDLIYRGAFRLPDGPGELRQRNPGGVAPAVRSPRASTGCWQAARKLPVHISWSVGRRASARHVGWEAKMGP